LPPYNGGKCAVAGHTAILQVRDASVGCVRNKCVTIQRRVRHARRIHDTEVLLFAFFSNRLGCMGSLIVSVIGTLLLLLIMGVIRVG
jgi:hypothetical protein